MNALSFIGRFARFRAHFTQTVNRLPFLMILAGVLIAGGLLHAGVTAT
jgi:hypothetical protein